MQRPLSQNTPPVHVALLPMRSWQPKAVFLSLLQSGQYGQTRTPKTWRKQACIERGSHRSSTAGPWQRWCDDHRSREGGPSPHEQTDRSRKSPARCWDRRCHPTHELYLDLGILQGIILMLDHWTSCDQVGSSAASLSRSVRRLRRCRSRTQCDMTATAIASAF